MGNLLHADKLWLIARKNLHWQNFIETVA